MRTYTTAGHLESPFPPSFLSLDLDQRASLFLACSFVLCPMSKVGQNRIYTVYIRYFLQGFHLTYSHMRRIYTVLAFWPTLPMSYVPTWPSEILIYSSTSSVVISPSCSWLSCTASSSAIFFSRAACVGKVACFLDSVINALTTT